MGLWNGRGTSLAGDEVGGSLHYVVLALAVGAAGSAAIASLGDSLDESIAGRTSSPSVTPGNSGFAAEVGGANDDFGGPSFIDIIGNATAGFAAPAEDGGVGNDTVIVSDGGEPGDFGGEPGDFGGEPGDFGGEPGDFSGGPGDVGGEQETAAAQILGGEIDAPVGTIYDALPWLPFEQSEALAEETIHESYTNDEILNEWWYGDQNGGDVPDLSVLQDMTESEALAWLAEQLNEVPPNRRIKVFLSYEERVSLGILTGLAPDQFYAYGFSKEDGFSNPRLTLEEVSNELGVSTEDLLSEIANASRSPLETETIAVLADNGLMDPQQLLDSTQLYFDELSGGGEFITRESLIEAIRTCSDATCRALAENLLSSWTPRVESQHSSTSVPEKAIPTEKYLEVILKTSKNSESMRCSLGRSKSTQVVDAIRFATERMPYPPVSTSPSAPPIGRMTTRLVSSQTSSAFVICGVTFPPHSKQSSSRATPVFF